MSYGLPHHQKPEKTPPIEVGIHVSALPSNLPDPLAHVRWQSVDPGYNTDVISGDEARVSVVLHAGFHVDPLAGAQQTGEATCRGALLGG